MSDLPRHLSAGTALSANWLNRLLDALRARELRAGPGIRLTRTPSGTTVSAAAQGEAALPDCFPGVVTTYSGDDQQGLTVRPFPNGLGTRSSLSGSTSNVPEITVYPTDLTPGFRFARGDAILVHRVAAQAADADTAVDNSEE